MSFKSTRVVRIEWGDCDPAGIIFYPTYFKIFDNATAMLFERALGMNKNQYLKAYDFAGFPLVDTRAKFIRPTRYGDDVSVESTVNFGKSSFTVEHKIGSRASPTVASRQPPYRKPCWRNSVSRDLPKDA
jgi:4-hydroxybenzoyl-CoA thioesterase